MRYLFPLLGSLALLTACTARAPAPELARAPTATEPTQTVADLLAMAHTAASLGSRGQEKLVASLAALDTLGAHPADPQDDPVSGWREQLPAGAVPPVRGRILGPAYRRGTLAGGATMTMDQLFDGGRQARVAVATPTATPFRIAVRDGAGKSICGPASGAREQCNWTPAFSGRHQIELSNPGPTTATYYLVID